MQKHRVEFHPDFWDTLDDIYDRHYRLSGINSADNISAEIMKTVGLLNDNPYIGFSAKNRVLARKGYRTLVCSKRYLCFYTVENEVAHVRRIVDGRTNYIKNFDW